MARFGIREGSARRDDEARSLRGVVKHLWMARRRGDGSRVKERDESEALLTPRRGGRRDGDSEVQETEEVATTSVSRCDYHTF